MPKEPVKEMPPSSPKSPEQPSWVTRMKAKILQKMNEEEAAAKESTEPKGELNVETASPEESMKERVKEKVQKLKRRAEEVRNSSRFSRSWRLPKFPPIRFPPTRAKNIVEWSRRNAHRR